jgi:hypothetical protein
VLALFGAADEKLLASFLFDRFRIQGSYQVLSALAGGPYLDKD